MAWDATHDPIVLFDAHSDPLIYVFEGTYIVANSKRLLSSMSYSIGQSSAESLNVIIVSLKMFTTWTVHTLLGNRNTLRKKL